MATPTITVEIAFASAPLAVTQVWANVTDYVDAIWLRRGRQTELARVEAGRLRLTLDNADGRFSPLNTQSPYYPNVIPSRRVRVSATWNSVTYRLFTGFIDAWPPEWGGGLLGTVEISATDAFKRFTKSKLTTTRSQETVTARITGVLTTLGWNPAEASIATSQSFIQSGAWTQQTALSIFLEAAETENGAFFINGAGVATFQNRYHRLTNTRSTTSQATFGDGTSELPYQQVQLLYDDLNIYNDVQITRTGGTTQIASDAASQVKYFVGSYTRTLPILTDNEANDAANWILYTSKEADIRARALTVSGYDDDALWPHVLGLEISDLVTVRKRPPGSSDTIDRSTYIESVEHTIGLDSSWTTTYQLSPASAGSWFVLDDPTRGRLDFNALAY
ncbi:MAG TPA: hypothetical protein VFS21_33290 [Roseiflexaceae bacterium]|nr:hypothetical protein [Roseiflexaceae bacterium]